MSANVNKNYCFVGMDLLVSFTKKNALYFYQNSVLEYKNYGGKQSASFNFQK